MPKKRPTNPPVEESRELRALRARLAAALGEKLTQKQSSDIAWLEKTERDRIIAEFVAAVPKGVYCDLASRQHKLVADAARLYDLPLDGPTIDLKAAITALHDFIAANAVKLRAVLDGERDELEDEKLRQQIAKLQIENDRLGILLKKDKGEAIDRAQLASALAEVIAVLREYGRSFERISAEARRLYNDMMDALAMEIESGRLRF